MDRCNEIKMLKNRSEGDIKMIRETDQNENPFWVFAIRKTSEYPDLTPNSGKTWKIPYKTDEDTFSGKYVQTGHKRISKYYI